MPHFCMKSLDIGQEIGNFVTCVILNLVFILLKRFINCNLLERQIKNFHSQEISGRLNIDSLNYVT